MLSRRGLTACDNRGQATVEYAIVFVAFLALVVALGALWDVLSGALVVQHALQSASHHLSGVAPGVIFDAFLY